RLATYRVRRIVLLRRRRLPWRRHISHRLQIERVARTLEGRDHLLERLHRHLAPQLRELEFARGELQSQTIPLRDRRCLWRYESRLARTDGDVVVARDVLARLDSESRVLRLHGGPRCEHHRYDPCLHHTPYGQATSLPLLSAQTGIVPR